MSEYGEITGADFYLGLFSQGLYMSLSIVVCAKEEIMAVTFTIALRYYRYYCTTGSHRSLEDSMIVYYITILSFSGHMVRKVGHNLREITVTQLASPFPMGTT